MAAAAPRSARAQDRLLDLTNLPGLTGRPVPQAVAAPALPPSSGPIDPSEYVLGPGDVLQLNLTGSVTRSWDLVVSPDGTLYVPTVGSMRAAGGTLLDVRQTAVQRVGAVYRGVAPDLRLVRPRMMLVHLTGQTRLSGPLEVFATSRVGEILADTMFTDRASLRNIQVIRQTPAGERRLPVDLLSFRLTGERGPRLLLRDGDVIHVPVWDTHIGIWGAVGHPAELDLAPGDSLSTLLALGGGPLSGAQDRAVLVRFRDETHLDTLAFRISDVLAGRFNVPLRDGDHASLYYSPHYHVLASATIYGEVVRPGAYPLDEGRTRLSDVASAAGGFLPEANLSALRVFRANRAANEPDAELDRLSGLSRKEMTASEYEVLRARTTALREDFRVDWTRARRAPDLDPLLRAGDVIRVDPVLASVRVEGEVRRPGLVRFESRRRIREYIALAGGFSQRAAPSQVRVTRAVTGQTILARDVPELAPGDLIWVPEHGETATWQNLQSLLLVLAQIATVIVAVRPR